MTESRLVVLDSSVGVRWLKPSEGGANRALALLEDHRDRRLRIVVSSHFVAETVGVAVRHGGPDLGEDAWRLLQASDLTVIGLDDAAATAAFEQCRILGCCFYDALAPALAVLLGATLYSADGRAHGQFPGVVLLG